MEIPFSGVNRRRGAAPHKIPIPNRTRLVQLPHVFLQVEVATKAFAAHVTGEGLFVIVRVHVEGEIVDLVEGFGAHAALVRLFAAVRQLVVLVVALLVETFSAVLADEGFVPSVDAGVGVQRGGAVERFAARVTLVGLLRRVDDLVTTQRRRLAKTFSADLADERSSSCVNRHVTCQVVVSVENLAALAAFEAFLLRGVDGRGTLRIDCRLRARNQPHCSLHVAGLVVH